MQTEDFDMNLFENKNSEVHLGNNLSRYAKNNGFRLLSKAKDWTLFDKDELKVEVKFVEQKNKKKIEFKTPLFEEINYSLMIFIRPICAEKFIRDIAKSDLIGKFGDKIYLIRYINDKENIYTDKTIDYNLSSLIKKSNKLKEEISSLLDYIMFIKLN